MAGFKSKIFLSSNQNEWAKLSINLIIEHTSLSFTSNLGLDLRDISKFKLLQCQLLEVLIILIFAKKKIVSIVQTRL